MRRLTAALGTAVTGLVLTVSWPTHLDEVGAATVHTAAAGPPAATALRTLTYEGAASATRIGDVQVRITISGGAVASATAIHLPAGASHRQINSAVIPLLNEEVVAAQSAEIAMVSGATLTSRAYLRSLQSALDLAGK